MSNKVIVTIVSEQTIQNVLFIKELAPANKYYFVSSPKMEKNHTTENIISAAGLNTTLCNTINVVEDSLLDIETKLNRELTLEDEDDVYVNITGGTKLMSLGVYNFFSRYGTAKIFYIPIGKNELCQVFPLKRNLPKNLDFRINLENYLKAYGVSYQDKSFKNKNRTIKPADVTEDYFKNFLLHRSEMSAISEKIRLSHRGFSINESKAEEIDLFRESIKLSDFGMKFDTKEVINKKETKYITGEWFEEYLYPIIRCTLNKSDDEIGMGIQLIKNETPNEYDIVFTHKNSLYVIECKTDVSDDEEGKINTLFTNTLYKAATLKKDFGLVVKFYLFALNDFSKLTDTQKKRASKLDINLVGLEEIADEEKLRDYISNDKF
ncbi:MAG: DUF1887 family protein [Chitinophagaceae bacterium]|nr:DUF1887 family protein [Chitinophagaceae bacterium]